ncbi:MAG: T9SS type A sorting domain-containing protein [Bacteroidetes bacterium]|nr:T9SS type A sorting domain-containing protein [Bacteroidota bacterium]
MIYSYAKTNATPGAVRSIAAGTSGNYYLDFQVPMAALNARLGIDEHTHLRLFYGTSASGGTINKDYMTGSAVDFLGLTTTNFDGIFHGGLTPQPVELVSFATFPSPARGVTTVNYTLAEGGSVELSLHDMAGRRLRTLHAAMHTEAGVQAAVFDVAGLSHGTYMLRLRHNEGTMYHPVMIMH